MIVGGLFLINPRASFIRSQYVKKRSVLRYVEMAYSINYGYRQFFCVLNKASLSTQREICIDKFPILSIIFSDTVDI
jgi:hypothetical protein